MSADPTTVSTAATDAGAPPLLEAEGLSVHFPVRTGLLGSKQHVHAVDDVSFAIQPGETLGLVGESGSGKTTLGYAVLGHHKPTAGRIRFEGQDVTGIKGGRLRLLRADMQMIFQDPFSSLNPRMKIGDIVAEPLLVHKRLTEGAALRERAVDLLERCGMPASAADRYPHAFSGGQRQRIGIARALALEPKLIVADEPTSALDVSVQAQVVNLLQDLQADLGLSYLFISHDLSVVRHISHRIAIMYLGRVVELAPAAEVFDAPKHPYTQALLSAIPVPDPTEDWHANRVALTGDIPSPIDPPPGCRFASRCPIAIDRCRTESPPLEEKQPGHLAACWRVDVGSSELPVASMRVGDEVVSLAPADRHVAGDVEMDKAT